MDIPPLRPSVPHTHAGSSADNRKSKPASVSQNEIFEGPQTGKYLQLLKSMEISVNSEKVEQVRQAIESGQYSTPERLKNLAERLSLLI